MLGYNIVNLFGDLFGCQCQILSFDYAHIASYRSMYTASGEGLGSDYLSS